METQRKSSFFQSRLGAALASLGLVVAVATGNKYLQRAQVKNPSLPIHEIKSKPYYGEPVYNLGEIPSPQSVNETTIIIPESGGKIPLNWKYNEDYSRFSNLEFQVDIINRRSGLTNYSSTVSLTTNNHGRFEYDLPLKRPGLYEFSVTATANGLFSIPTCRSFRVINWGNFQKEFLDRGSRNQRKSLPSYALDEPPIPDRDLYSEMLGLDLPPHPRSASQELLGLDYL